MQEEYKRTYHIMDRFLSEYQKAGNVAVTNWMPAILCRELPQLTNDDAVAMSREIEAKVDEYDKNLVELNQSCERGRSKESWFASQLRKASEGTALTDFARYLSEIDQTLAANNQAMLETINTQAGNVSQNPNLDGFIGEQAHANSFNRNAALQRSSERAVVKKPSGVYGKNSVDISIVDKNNGNRPIKNYQAKYGKTAEHTANAVKNGDYRQQRILVPEGQVDDVKDKLPGNKSVSDRLESSDGSVQSDPLSKEKAKEIQEKVQQGKEIPQEDWNVFKLKDLAENIGKQAAIAGVGAAALSGGFHVAQKVVEGEKIDTNEAVKVALESGADAGLKAATAGALKVAAEKELLPLLGKGTPAGVLATIASAGIENAKIAKQYAEGKIDGQTACDRAGRTSVAMTLGLVFSGMTAEAGAAVGAAIGSVVPGIGTATGAFVGEIAGGMVGYMAGSDTGNKIYTGAKKIAKKATSAVKTMVSEVKSVGKKIYNGLKSLIFG